MENISKYVKGKLLPFQFTFKLSSLHEPSSLKPESSGPRVSGRPIPDNVPQEINNIQIMHSNYNDAYVSCPKYRSHPTFWNEILPAIPKITSHTQFGKCLPALLITSRLYRELRKTLNMATMRCLIGYDQPIENEKVEKKRNACLII
jgi:hypothetical protein